MRARNIATLTIPSPEGKEQVPLRLDTEGARLLTSAGTELDRELFLSLRDRRGAMIIADDPKQIRKLLRLAPTDSAVVDRGRRRGSQDS
jgi:hypothetical protein